MSASTTLPSYTPRDGVWNEYNGQIVLVENNLNSIRTYSNTCVFQASSALGFTPAGVSIVNSSSAVVVSSSNTSIALVTLTLTASQVFTGVTAGLNSSTARGQIVSADPSTGIVFYIPNGDKTIEQFNTNTFTAQSFTLPMYSGDQCNCIILKSPGRWLIGTLDGYIYEIDVNGVVQDCYSLVLPAVRAPLNALTAITNLAYDNNMLLVSTNQMLFYLDWSTKTQIPISPTIAGGNTNGITLCSGASGETLAVLSGISAVGNNSIVAELDFTIQPGSCRGQIYWSNNQPPITIGLSQNYAMGFGIDNSQKTLAVFNVSTRGTTTETFNIPPGNSISGVAQGRVILANDPGIGDCFVEWDTYMRFPGTYRVPTGQTLMPVYKLGDGANALFYASRFNT
jgi:hypothetical protein